MIIRKWNGTDTWAAQSVQTDLRALRTTNAKLGSTVESDFPFDTSYKLKVAHLPDSVFGGMVFVGTVSASGVFNNTLDLNELISESVANSSVITVSQQLDDLTSLNYGANGSDYADIGQRYIGHYWVVSGSNPVNFGDADDTSGTWATGAKDDGSDPGSSGNAYLYAEAGDWIIITGWNNTNKQWSFSIVNNTYRAASTSNPGLMSAADKTKLDGIAASANNYTHPTYKNSCHHATSASSTQLFNGV